MSANTPLPAEEGGRPTVRFRCDKCRGEFQKPLRGRCPHCGVGVDIGNLVPASVVSSEEGGREVALPNAMTSEATKNGIAQLVTRPASVVGDASEGEADAERKRITDIVSDCLLRNRFNPGNAEAVFGVVDRLLASLRSTRAALEEARKDAERVNAIERFLASGAEKSVIVLSARWESRDDKPAAFKACVAEMDTGIRDHRSIREAIDYEVAPRAIPSQESETNA